jgi:hypothetical protein
MVRELAVAMSSVLESLPEEHPQRELLRRLDAAIQRNWHFIEGDQESLFQCLWNTCWWYDCPELTRHLTHSF